MRMKYFLIGMVVIISGTGFFKLLAAIVSPDILFETLSNVSIPFSVGIGSLLIAYGMLKEFEIKT